MQHKILALIRPLPIWRPVVSFKFGEVPRIILHAFFAITFALVMLILLSIGLLISSSFRQY